MLRISGVVDVANDNGASRTLPVSVTEKLRVIRRKSGTGEHAQKKREDKVVSRPGRGNAEGGRDRPVVILGRCHENISLSSVYPDTEASARHAAGMLFSRGHREMIYLIAELTSLSDRRASEVFVAEARRLGAQARICPELCVHDGKG